MASFPHSVPTDDTDAGYFARQLAVLVGPAIQAPDRSVSAHDYLSLGEALADERTMQAASLAEAFPSEATELLAEWESILGLPTRQSETAAARRSYLVAKTRAAIAGTPQTILRAVQVECPEATLTENVAADCTAAPRSVFHFVIVISTAHWASSTLRGRLTAIVEQMKSAHTSVTFATRIGFFCDDPGSLVDRDVLGS